MTYLFSPEGMTALRAFIDAKTLFAFDLDGTLAPIVSDPAGIRISDSVRQRLVRLNNLAPFAVITGRSRIDALTHLGFTPRFLIGNHGAEGLPGTAAKAADFFAICLEWRAQLTHILPGMTDLGIVLEEKGQSLALHYRKATDPNAARLQILAAIELLQPAPRVVSGIYVKNLAPVDAPHKGVALNTLMKHLGCGQAIFVGDDVTDEDVFEMKNSAILGIRVGESQESHADCFIKDQVEGYEIQKAKVEAEEKYLVEKSDITF